MKELESVRRRQKATSAIKDITFLTTADKAAILEMLWARIVVQRSSEGSMSIHSS